MNKYEAFEHMRKDAKTRSWHRAASRVGNAAEEFVFVTGFDKSGTTWLQRMLDSHPDVVCRASGQFFNFYDEETHFLSTEGGYRFIARAVLESDWFRDSGHTWILREAVENAARELIAASLTGHRDAAGARIAADKSVVQDCRLIRSVFPGARIVAITRDGRDVAVSFAHQFRRKGRTNKFSDEETGRLDARFLKDVSTAWARYNFHLHEFAARDSVYFPLTYESLLDDAVGLMQDVFRFIGIRSDNRLVADIVEKNSFERLSGGRKPGEENNDDFFRKGIVGDWVNHFSKENAKVFEEQAGDVLRLLGYERLAETNVTAEVQR